MELQYYETIRETVHLQVRFEPVLSPAGVFPAHWHESVSYTHLDVYKRQVLSSPLVTASVISSDGSLTFLILHAARISVLSSTCLLYTSRCV